MSAIVVEAEISEAFNKLRAKLAGDGYQIVEEQAPKTLTVAQGSIWGTTAETAKKKITYTLTQKGNITEITSNSVLAPSFVHLIILGCFLCLLLFVLCSWIGLDLWVHGGNGFWGGLANVGGRFNGGLADMYLGLSSFCVAVLFVSFVAEAFIVLRVRREISRFAMELTRC